MNRWSIRLITRDEVSAPWSFSGISSRPSPVVFIQSHLKSGIVWGAHMERVKSYRQLTDMMSIPLRGEVRFIPTNVWSFLRAEERLDVHYARSWIAKCIHE